MSRAVIDVRPAAALTAPEWEEIWQLTRRFYVTERRFAEDNRKYAREWLEGTPAERRGRRLAHFLVDVGEQHVGSGRGERLRRGAPDARRRSRHYCVLAVQLHHRSPVESLSSSRRARTMAAWRR